MIQAIVFDFDGLILDTETSIFESWREVYREHGCDLNYQFWAKTVGVAPGMYDLTDDLAKCLGHPVDAESINAQQQAREAELVAVLEPLPGVADYLVAAEALGLRLAIASSSDMDWVGGHLARLGWLDRFEVIRTIDIVKVSKPKPDLYLAALEGLSVEAANALALEDSPIGATAAINAGIFTVAVPNQITRHYDFDHVDLVLPSLEALSLEALLVKVEEKRIEQKE